MSKWQDSLKEEYAQLKEKYEKLKAYNNSVEIKRNLESYTETVTDDYYHKLMRDQQHTMGEYLHLLELRAELKGIKL